MMEKHGLLNPGTLPEPEVSGLRVALEFAAMEVSRGFAEIEAVSARLESAPGSVLEKELSDLLLSFYSSVSFIFISAGPYVAPGDKEDFERYKERIRRRWSVPLNLSELLDLCNFVQVMLRNSNIIELGKKSFFHEIVSGCNLEWEDRAVSDSLSVLSSSAEGV